MRALTSFSTDYLSLSSSIHKVPSALVYRVTPDNRLPVRENEGDSIKMVNHFLILFRSAVVLAAIRPGPNRQYLF